MSLPQYLFERFLRASEVGRMTAWWDQRQVNVYSLQRDEEKSVGVRRPWIRRKKKEGREGGREEEGEEEEEDPRSLDAADFRKAPRWTASPEKRDEKVSNN